MSEAEQKAEPRICQLYLVNPPLTDVAAFAATLESTLAASPRGVVGAFRLSMDNTADADVENAARILQPICKQYKVAFLLQGRPQLATKIQADGVQLGPLDMPVKLARQLVGEEVVIGKECQLSKDIAMQAGEEGADYVTFGPFGDERAFGEVLSWWQTYFVLPCVARGVSSFASASALIKSGADFIEVTADFWSQSQDPAEGVQGFEKVIKQALQSL